MDKSNKKVGMLTDIDQLLSIEKKSPRKRSIIRRWRCDIVQWGWRNSSDFDQWELIGYQSRYRTEYPDIRRIVADAGGGSEWGEKRIEQYVFITRKIRDWLFFSSVCRCTKSVIFKTWDTLEKWAINVGWVWWRIFQWEGNSLKI